MTRNRAIEKLVAKGESKMIEFKRSTGELREALQTLCAFANGSGGKVVIPSSTTASRPGAPAGIPRASPPRC